MTERGFVNSIRGQYSGLQELPRESLASSVKTLADDLYAKDTHFIFELIQNAEDNDYAPDKPPSLRFEVCQQEIDGEFGPVLIVHNNETGFQEENVRAICQVGKSTKKKVQGYIGEKGIGFKSVFRVTKRPYIISNRFQFCLPEDDEETGLGYIVPRWVEDPPVKCIAGETTIVLPLNKSEGDVVNVVKALRDIAPETILFLNKLTSLDISVHLPDDEHEIAVKKCILIEVGESRLVELTYVIRSTEGDESLESSQYWLTEIEFPKPANIHHEKRKDIESRTVSVAIPLGPNVHEGKLFAYLPVWESTGLPFLVNADFLLVSSREGVREDEPWSKWLRDCIAETFCKAFLDLLNATEVPLETKMLAYGTIPLESHRAFLKPVVAPIHKFLATRECVLVLPDDSLVKPSIARLCYQNFRDVLDASDRLPQYLRENARLVCPELEAFSTQLEAIGVKRFLLSEIVSCLQDHLWVQSHASIWFVDLFRYLSTQKFDPKVLRPLKIVPIIAQRDNRTAKREMSCAAEQPLYFSCSEEDQKALKQVPEWLSKFVPIAFLDVAFVSALSEQEDKDALSTWLTKTLNIYPFSIKNYCAAAFSKLNISHHDIKDSELVQATEFLVQNAGSLQWEKLPLILSDSRRMSPAHIQKSGEDIAAGEAQEIVVPENYNLESGWQHIWKTETDRRHFVILSQTYPSKIVEFLTGKKLTQKYPSPQKITVTNWGNCTEYEQSCWRNSKHSTREKQITNYRPPSCLSANASIEPRTSKAILEWLKFYDLTKSEHATVWYFYYRDHERNFPSELLVRLKGASWLPSTKGLVCPSQAFLPKQGIREIFGDTVPYFEGELPENIVRLLEIRSEVTVEQLLDLLRQNSGSTDTNPDLVRGIYEELDIRTRSSPQEVRTRFSNEALILVKGSHGATARWCKSSECVWEDASEVLGDNLACLERQYPKLQDFFIGRIGVKRRVDTESFAQRWLKLQGDPVANSEQQRALVDRLYREIKPAALATDRTRPLWWPDFSKKAKVYTQSDSFELPSKVVLPDDGELRDIFQTSSVEFAWRPEKDAYNDWAPFYTTLGTPLLSESVTEHLEDDVQYEVLGNRRFVTESTVKMIAAWLREKRPDDYKRLLDKGVFKNLISLQEATTPSEIKVRFWLKVNSVDESEPITYPIFWEQANNVLIYGDASEKSHIAKVIAKGLITDHAYKELAHWIELTLEAADTKRLKNEGWSVPQEILALFTQSASAPTTPTSLSAPINATGATQPRSEVIAPLSISQPIQATQPQESSLSDSQDETPKPDGQQQVAAPSSFTIRPTPQLDSKLSSQPRVLGTPVSSSSPHSFGQNAPENSQRRQETGKPDVEDIDEQGTGAEDRSNYGSRPNHAARDQLDYLEELRKSFNRDGQIEFSDEDESSENDSVIAVVKNPQRRREKLAEGYRDSIQSEPSPEERRNIVERALLEGPNEHVRVSLHEWYRGKCQICGETWPKRNGEPYFAAAYLVKRRHARWVDEPGNAICLCARHFAQWQLAAIETPLDIVEQIQSLRLSSEGGNGNLSIDFIMLGKDHAISYNETHFLALRTLLEEASRSVSA